jgi:DNA-binding response OmpR family regulator
MIKYQTLYNETKQLSVLLVEDYPALREEMNEVLEHLFLKVVCASDGQEALARYADGFDLVISDIQMPYMNGVSLCEQIRCIDNEQPIIIVSAHTESKYLLDLINMGISQFLVKPIEHDRLFHALYDVSVKINSIKERQKEHEQVHLGESYYWDTQKELLKHKESLIDLTKHELLLLKFFLNKRDIIYNHNDIIHYFYEQNIDLSEKNIRNLIFRVRKKIPEQCLVNIYGLGYKFTLEHLK